MACRRFLRMSSTVGVLLLLVISLVNGSLLRVPRTRRSSEPTHFTAPILDPTRAAEAEHWNRQHRGSDGVLGGVLKTVGGVVEGLTGSNTPDTTQQVAQTISIQTDPTLQDINGLSFQDLLRRLDLKHNQYSALRRYQGGLGLGLGGGYAGGGLYGDDFGILPFPPVGYPRPQYDYYPSRPYGDDYYYGPSYPGYGYDGDYSGNRYSSGYPGRYGYKGRPRPRPYPYRPRPYPFGVPDYYNIRPRPFPLVPFTSDPTLDLLGNRRTGLDLFGSTGGGGGGLSDLLNLGIGGRAKGNNGDDPYNNNDNSGDYNQDSSYPSPLQKYHQIEKPSYNPPDDNSYRPTKQKYYG